MIRHKNSRSVLTHDHHHPYPTAGVSPLERWIDLISLLWLWSDTEGTLSVWQSDQAEIKMGPLLGAERRTTTPKKKPMEKSRSLDSPHLLLGSTEETGAVTNTIVFPTGNVAAELYLFFTWTQNINKGFPYICFILTKTKWDVPRFCNKQFLNYHKIQYKRVFVLLDFVIYWLTYILYIQGI